MKATDDAGDDDRKMMLLPEALGLAFSLVIGLICCIDYLWPVGIRIRRSGNFYDENFN
jgi:hypothetical protein